jgi:phage baseplate assembly protein W
MPTFIGFSTIGQCKKFTLTDFELIKQDLFNALNIQQGSLPGRPGYGTTIWGFVFENQTEETQAGMITELQRVVGGDPRLFLNDAQVYPQENGILIEMQVQIVPTTSVERLNIFFDQNTRRASFI